MGSKPSYNKKQQLLLCIENCPYMHIVLIISDVFIIVSYTLLTETDLSNSTVARVPRVRSADTSTRKKRKRNAKIPGS